MTDEESVICPSCRGSGIEWTSDEPDDVCPVCGGEGLVQAPPPAPEEQP